MTFRAPALVLLLFLGTAAAAQPDTLWVTPEVRDSLVKLGEPFSVTVRLPRAPGDSLEGPKAPAAMGPLDIRTSVNLSTADSLVWRIEGALFEVGEVALPAVPFLLRTEKGPRFVMTRPHRMSVEATAPDTAQALKGIKPPIPTPLRWEWFMVAGFLMGAALILWFIWFWRKHRLDAEPWVERIPLDPPRIEAHKALTELEREALPARGMVRDHYFRLSGILRRYMERRFGFPAVEWTTGEIAPALHHVSGLENRQCAGALEILDRADLVKFAKANPGGDTAQEDLRSVRAWVDRTAGADDGGEERA